MTTLQLKGRGVEITLFAPRFVQGGVEAHAFLSSAPLTRRRTLHADNNTRFTAPKGLPQGFRLGRVFLPLEG